MSLLTRMLIAFPAWIISVGWISRFFRVIWLPVVAMFWPTDAAIRCCILMLASSVYDPCDTVAPTDRREESTAPPTSRIKVFRPSSNTFSGNQAGRRPFFTSILYRKFNDEMFTFGSIEAALSSRSCFMLYWGSPQNSDNKAR